MQHPRLYGLLPVHLDYLRPVLGHEEPYDALARVVYEGKVDEAEVGPSMLAHHTAEARKVAGGLVLGLSEAPVQEGAKGEVELPDVEGVSGAGVSRLVGAEGGCATEPHTVRQ